MQEGRPKDDQISFTHIGDCKFILKIPHGLKTSRDTSAGLRAGVSPPQEPDLKHSSAASDNPLLDNTLEKTSLNLSDKRKQLKEDNEHDVSFIRAEGGDSFPHLREVSSKILE